jgi:hypothetical protein
MLNLGHIECHSFLLTKKRLFYVEHCVSVLSIGTFLKAYYPPFSAFLVVFIVGSIYLRQLRNSVTT